MTRSGFRVMGSVLMKLFSPQASCPLAALPDPLSATQMQLPVTPKVFQTLGASVCQGQGPG
jgi:hypothetical protein